MCGPAKFDPVFGMGSVSFTTEVKAARRLGDCLCVSFSTEVKAARRLGDCLCVSFSTEVKAARRLGDCLCGKAAKAARRNRPSAWPPCRKRLKLGARRNRPLAAAPRQGERVCGLRWIGVDWR